MDKFFSARLSNAHTRTAYAHQVGRFLAWCEEEGPQLRQVTPGLAGHAHPRTTQNYDRRRASRRLGGSGFPSEDKVNPVDSTINNARDTTERSTRCAAAVR